MFKFILITLIILFVFGRIFKYLLKYFIVHAMSNQAQAFQKASQKRPTNDPEGTVKVKSEKGSPGSKEFEGGEYIDYEVIK